MINVFLNTNSNYSNNYCYLVNKYKDAFYDSVLIDHKFNIFAFDDGNELINKRNALMADLYINTIFNSNKNNNISIYYSDKQNGLIKQICENIKLSIMDSKVIPRQFDVILSNNEYNNLSKNISNIVLEFNIEETNTNWLFNDIILNTLSNRIVNILNRYSDMLDKNSLYFVDTHTLAKDFFNDNILDNVKNIVPLIKKCQQDTGLLTSVSVAQFVLETSHGRSDLLKDTNNCFGMKSFVSNNNWYGTCWNNEIYHSDTIEQYNGEIINIISEFRKYPDIETSIVDHCSYLLNAKRGKAYRYKNINICNNYIEVCNMLNTGGYSIVRDYGKKLIEIVERYDLTKFDN